jgi:UDP-N-acetylmuramoyl-tripeptide--D-alanyl-D-alanine ligase
MTTGEKKWGVSIVLEATGGRLVAGDGNAVFKAISTDSRTFEPGELFVAIRGEKFDGHQFVKQVLENGAGGVLVDEAFAAKELPDVDTGACVIAVPACLQALGDLAAYYRRQNDASVVAITGTNGKTTTKEMTATVLGQMFSVLKTEGNFNNLIGLPLTLFGLKEDHEWAVLEIAMNHPGEIARLAHICKPQVGVLTNIAPGHLEGVRDLDGVMKAKGELLEGLGEEGTAVLNIDDQRICKLAEKFDGRVISFGIQNSAEVWATPVSQTASHCTFDISWFDESVRVRLGIPGQGTVYNALAAAAVGYRLGLSLKEVKAGLEATATLPGRLEVIALAKGIHLINDTYNANPGSMAQAIETLCALKGNGRGVFIAGDMLELGAHAESAHKELGISAARGRIARLYATGEFARTLADGAVGAGMDPKRVFVGSKGEILEALKGHLGPGDWVLVKGSRLMAMEEVVTGLRDQFGSERKTPNLE